MHGLESGCAVVDGERVSKGSRHKRGSTDELPPLVIPRAAERLQEAVVPSLGLGSLIALTQDAWKYTDGFITSHRVIPEESIGLREQVTAHYTIRDFVTACEEMSKLYKELFLQPSDSSSFLIKQFSRLLHSSYEECLLNLTPLVSKERLNGQDLFLAVCRAHVLRNEVGDLLVKMEGMNSGRAQ